MFIRNIEFPKLEKTPPLQYLLLAAAGVSGATYLMSGFLRRRKNRQVVEKRRHDVAGRKEDLTTRLLVEGVLVTPERTDILKLGISGTIQIL